MSCSLYGNHIPRCQHIKTNGTQCGSPALRRKRFCFFHNRWRATRLNLNRAGTLQATTTVELPVLEDADSIQVSLMEVMRLIICRQLDHKTGGLLLYGLQTASHNLNRVDFEHCHKSSIVIDPQSVRETGVGDEAWDPEDFDEEEEPREESPQEEHAIVVSKVSVESRVSVERAPSPATLSTETTAASQNEEWQEVQRMESALEGAEQGNWRDLKTVFELAGIFPAKTGATSDNNVNGG